MGNIDSIATMDTLYPAYDVSADVLVFPAAFELDIDHDGKKDLMVAPNANSGINSVQSSWFYKNTGTATSTVYSFVESDFLQNSMIDHGERSIFLLRMREGLKNPWRVENTFTSQAPQHQKTRTKRRHQRTIWLETMTQRSSET